VNFYRRFIQDFSAKARPLFDLTRSKQVWTWSGKEQAAFKDLKTAVTTALVLVSPQESDLFQIEADSSDFATGAVLSQQSTTDGKWHFIAFYSKFLSSVERNYEIHDKKMLTIIHMLEEWRHFLEGVIYPVEIWTDHKNLEYFMTAKKLNHRQARWSLHLARFDFLLHYRLDIQWANRTHCQGELITETEPPTMRTLSSFNQSSLQYVPWKEWN